MLCNFEVIELRFFKLKMSHQGKHNYSGLTFFEFFPQSAFLPISKSADDVDRNQLVNVL